MMKRDFNNMDVHHDSESVSATLTRQMMRNWNQFTDMNPGLGTDALIRRGLLIAAASISAHRSGLGPFIPTTIKGRHCVLELSKFADKVQCCPPPGQGEKARVIGTVLSGDDLLYYNQVKAFLPIKTPQHILCSVINLGMFADYSENIDAPFEIVDHKQKRVVPLYETLQIGRYDPERQAARLPAPSSPLLGQNPE